MASITQFPGKQNDEDGMNFSQKLHLHKLKSLVKVLVVVAIIVIVASILIAYNRNLTYTRITTVNSVDRVSLETSSYINNNGSVIVYSKDGVNCIDEKGTVLWNMTYEMQNPIIRRSDVYVAACDYNGHVVNVIDMQGKTSTIDTKLPIRDFSICKEGLVAVIIEDSGNSWVNLYNVDGTKIAEIKATMSKTGYPLCVSLSGEVMAVSYLYVDSSSMESRVVFYNFGGVGENVPDKIVSSYAYNSAVVPYIEYLDSENVFAVADNRLMLYNGSKIPKSVVDKLIDENIVGVYYGASKVGLVFYDSTGENKYKLELYDKSGKLECTYRYNMDFKDILISSNQILIYNEAQCIVVGDDGTVKYNDLFESPVIYIATTGSPKRYLFVKENTLETVKFE